MALVLLAVLCVGLAPARARASEVIYVLGGEVLVLAGSAATTVGVSVCLGAEERPPTALTVAHFTLAFANVVSGAVITGFGLALEPIEALAGWIRTFMLAFGLTQLVYGILMGVIGGIALAEDDDGGMADAMLVPLTLSFP
ncbi:MAG: hypothetical protein IT379_05565 [Deltaproteobacteria bacterium]|nr:hypothetical protein [Deltaproteobacteria bacterium]